MSQPHNVVPLRLIHTDALLGDGRVDGGQLELVDFLKMLLRDAESGKLKASCGMFVHVAKDDGTVFEPNFYQFGMTMLECIGLADVAKTMFKDEMSIYTSVETG